MQDKKNSVNQNSVYTWTKFAAKVYNLGSGKQKKQKQTIELFLSVPQIISSLCSLTASEPSITKFTVLYK